MKRFGLMAAVVLALGLGGCDHEESVAKYDPSVDGLLPPPPAPDLSILENQRKLYDTMVAANGMGAKPVTASAPAATATAPVEGGAVPAPEGAGGATTAPAAAPSGGEGATPLPPKD